MSVPNAWGAWSLIPMGGVKFSLPRLRIFKGNSVSRRVPNIHATPACWEEMLFNPKILTAAKSSLTMLMKSCRQTHNWENI